MTSPTAAITLAVVAGGAGSRMGGPKHSLRICGRPILVDLLERAGWDGPTLLSLEHDAQLPIPGVERFGMVVHDQDTEQGPLAAIKLALSHCTTDALLAIPVDMCGLQHEHLRWVVDQAERASAIGLYLRRAASPDGIEPLPLYLRGAAAPLVEQTLATGRRAIRSFLSRPGVVAIDAPPHWPDSVWTNLNTPEDLIRAEQARGYTQPPSPPRP